MQRPPGETGLKSIWQPTKIQDGTQPLPGLSFCGPFVFMQSCSFCSLLHWLFGYVDSLLEQSTLLSCDVFTASMGREGTSWATHTYHRLCTYFPAFDQPSIVLSWICLFVDCCHAIFDFVLWGAFVLVYINCRLCLNSSTPFVVNCIFSAFILTACALLLKDWNYHLEHECSVLTFGNQVVKRILLSSLVQMADLYTSTLHLFFSSVPNI